MCVEGVCVVIETSLASPWGLVVKAAVVRRCSMSWRLARKMPARVAHKLPCQCDASGREGGEGDSTRSGKRGVAVGDAGCGVRACAGGAAAGPGAYVPSRAQNSTALDAKVPGNEQAGQELSG